MKTYRFFNKKLQRHVFFFTLCCAFFALNSAVFADRIKMRDGSVIYGKITEITVGKYKLRKADGSPQSVLKSKIRKVTFTGRLNDLGYINYFMRLYLGIGLAAYAEEKAVRASTGGPLSKGQNSSHLLARLGLEAGWMLIVNTLAAHGGWEYKQSQLLGENDIDYSYSALTAGLSWYFGLNRFGLDIDNLYLRPRIRLPLQGSVNSTSEDISSQTSSGTMYQASLKSAPLEGDGLGYGLSLGWEWIQGSFAYGLALSYSVDNFQVKRSDTLSELKAVPATVQYYGIDLSISYD